jgi:hypothetical protein
MKVSAKTGKSNVSNIEIYLLVTLKSSELISGSRDNRAGRSFDSPEYLGNEFRQVDQVNEVPSEECNK